METDVAVEPTAINGSAPTAPPITDVVIIVDTERSAGDRLVLRLDADGEPTTWMACGPAQLMWMINDPDYFWPAAWAMGRHTDPADLAEPGEHAPDGLPPDGLAEALVLLSKLTPDGRRALIERCNTAGLARAAKPDEPAAAVERHGWWARLVRRRAPGGEP